jgi:sugar O-acyltransferase (sialic acid O-acetyltransferase NeuD family)
MQETVKIVIIGASGNGLDIVDTLLDINQSVGYTKYELLGFLEDKEELQNKVIYQDYKVRGRICDFIHFDTDVFFVTAVGSSKSFLKKVQLLSSIPLSRFVTIIHPTAYISRSACIGKGNVVLQYTTIANNVIIGNQVVVLANTVINHNCTIGDYTCIASGVYLSGGVIIEENCYIGTGTTIRENVKIGKKCLIGMASNVLHDIPDYSKVMGNPARITGNTKEIKL